MAHLLGTGDGISYRDWQAAMLKKEEEFEQNGVMAGQTLANELYGKREENEGAFQATTIHQTFRGSGFGSRRGGFGRNRGAINRGRGRMINNNAQRGFNMQRTVARGGARMSTGAARGFNGNLAPRAGTQFQFGRGNYYPPRQCYTCVEEGHTSAQCYSRGEFQGYCDYCGEWGHKRSQCGTQKVHVSTDEYEQAEDGYPYHPASDYYDSYQGNNEQEEEEQQGVYNVMVKVLGAKENASMVANFASSLNINLDSYCTRHMTPCYELQNPKPCVVNIMVGNKEVLKSTHSGTLRLGNIIFNDVLFVPGLLQTLISEPQMELKGCKIVSENGIRTVSRNGKYLFHATLERNSYEFTLRMKQH